MTFDASQFPWEDFLGRSQPGPVHNISTFHQDKTVLITGACGSIGSALVESIAGSDSRALILLDSSENNLFRIENELDKANCSGAPHVPILGSVCDKHLLCDVFERYRPDTVYHTAAYKHVPLMEANPFAVVLNNALGTRMLARVMLRCDGCDLMLTFTDKAVNPRRLLGVSKRIAKLVVLALGNSGTRMKAICLGNAGIGRQGSPAFPSADRKWRTCGCATGGSSLLSHHDRNSTLYPWSFLD